MKDYESVAFHIRKAISLLQKDLSQDDNKSLLNRVLANLSKKEVKQNKRNSAQNKYIEEAKLKSKQWWDKIKENAIKNTDHAAELEQEVRDSVNNGS